MGNKKATLDTNILISALGWKGNPNRAFAKIVNGEIELIISDEQFFELSEILEYPKFQFTEEQKNRFKTLILELKEFRGIKIVTAKQFLEEL